MTFYKDMCIICFSPTKSNFNKLYGLRVYGRQDAIVSELGIIYQDLFQISLQLSDTHPMYVCNVCKKEILRFNELKKQALENYKKIIGEPEKTSELSTPSEINTASEINEATTLGETSESSEHLKRVEEITVFDISTRQTEKFEIQFLDDDSDQNHIDISNNEEEEGGVLHDIIEIEDSKSHLEGLINTTTNGTIDNQDDGLSNKIGYNAMLQIKCQLCGKQFDTNDEFNTHWSEHMPHYSFNCDKCPAKFHSEKYYRQHIAVHYSARTFKCKICGKVFRQQYIAYHMKLHADEKSYMCKTCGKKFRCLSHLNYHLYTHGKKRFQCEICLRFYRTPRTLREHHRSQHLDDLPFKCEICERKFLSKKSLEVHKGTHYKQKVKK